MIGGRIQTLWGAALISFLVMVPAPASADAWYDFATNSGTLSANSICHSDGSNILCPSTNPTVDGSGNLAIGTTALSGALNVQKNSTTTNATVYGVYVNGAQSTANTSSYYGGYFTPAFTGSAVTLANLYGGLFSPQNSGTGTATNMYGVFASPANTSTGSAGTITGVYAAPSSAGGGTVTTVTAITAIPQKTGTGVVTNLSAIWARCDNTNATGAVTNCYGLYLATPTTTGAITNEWGVYQQSATASNYFAGNVGIGAGTGYLNFGSSSLGTGGYGIRDNSGTLQYKNSGGAWANLTATTPWVISGSDIYYTTGNVAIGTTAPLEKLHVQGAASVTGGGYSTTGNALIYSDATLGPYLAGNTDSAGNATVTAAGTRLQIGSGGLTVATSPSTTSGSARTFTTRMTADISGNVGIGSASPGYKLDVTGTGHFTGAVTLGSTLSVAGAGSYSAGYGTMGTAATLVLGGGGSTPNGTSIAWGDNTGWKLNLGTNVSGTFTPRVTLVDSGNVGIGTTAPGNDLDVNGSFTARTAGGNSIGTTTAYAQLGLYQYGTLTAASAFARGYQMDTNLTASANSDVLQALRLTPTFTKGAYTGVTAYGIYLSSGAMDYGVYVATAADNYFAGNVGVGTTTMMGQFNVYSPSTNTNTDNFGIFVNGAQSVANTSSQTGIYANPTFSGSAVTLASLHGVYSIPQNTGTGTVTTLYGVVGLPEKTGTGPVTNMYGVFARTDNTNATGAITNAYGVYIATATATGTITNRYGLYQQDAAAINVFAGDTQFSSNTVQMTNATSNTIFYGTAGVAAPGAGSAGEKIQLYGTSGTVAASDYAIGIESSNLWFNTGGGFKWYVSGTEMMRMDSSGNVSIGATNTSYAFQVASTNTATSGTVYMSYNNMTVTPASASSGTSLASLSQTLATGAQNITGTIYGSQSNAQHNGSGTIGGARGAYNTVVNNSTGTITTAYAAFNLTQSQDTGGTITTAYGAYNQVNNLSQTGVITTAYGARNSVIDTGTGGSFSGSMTTAYGSWNEANSSGGGGIGTAVAVRARVTSSNMGQLANAYGVYSELVNGGMNGTDNWYGVYVAAVSGASGAPAGNRFPLYVADSGTSYFNGSVGIGTTTASQKLHVYTASGIGFRLQAGAALCNHTATAGSETVACSSDIRFKKDIVDTGSALEWFDDMRIRDFTMKETGERRTGVIAQELLKTHPDMVHLDDRKYYTVDQPNPWRFVKAVQELKADNDNQAAASQSLRKDVAALKADNDNLRREVEELRLAVKRSGAR